MKQPQIQVGILSADEINIKNHPDNSSFIIRNVPIGKGFHWERTEDQAFKGELKIIRENGTLTAINTLPLEDYIESVISSEMAATSSIELLKAHAVISRSWLIAQIEKAKKTDEARFSSLVETENEYIRWYDREDHLHFDVCADDHCQRYQGITRISTPAVREAVRATYGEFLVYDDEICDARFSKCCGGKTERFENTWEPAPHPYLTSVSDQPQSLSGDAKAFCDTSDKEILSQVLNNYDRETPDFYRWTVSYSQKEISELIRRKTGWDFGEIIDLIPMERGDSGRIIRLKIVGTQRTKIIGKELFIRKALSESHLYSSAFTVSICRDESGLLDNSAIPSSFTLHGSGWGHGVGLCQIGAAVMAAKGYDYQAILKHYFPNADLKKLYVAE